MYCAVFSSLLFNKKLIFCSINIIVNQRVPYDFTQNNFKKFLIDQSCNVNQVTRSFLAIKQFLIFFFTNI